MDPATKISDPLIRAYVKPGIEGDDARAQKVKDVYQRKDLRYGFVGGTVAVHEFIRKELKMNSEVRHVPMAEWGKDHWSLLGYVETVCVDRGGCIEPELLRCNPVRHPGLALAQHAHIGTIYPYGSRLRGGVCEPEHDDWDCFYDLEHEGLIRDVGTGMYPRAAMTERGTAIVAQLRAYKTSGGMYATFVPNLEGVPGKSPEANPTPGTGQVHHG